MKSFYLLAVVLLFGVTRSVAQEQSHKSNKRAHDKQETVIQDTASQPKWDGAHISFMNTKHDFGEVRRKGGDLKVKFEYVNDGTEPLIITRIATSCTCIRTDYRRRPLDVGERDVIELTYEPHKMEAGVFHKVVQVYSNSVDGMHLLTVGGNSVEHER